jgi:hypothetical protein
MYFDKPDIAVDFYPTPRGFWETVWRYTDDHIRKIIATGGVRHVKSPEELAAALAEYLKDPARDAAGRVAARALWFSHAEGHAGERIASELAACMDLP